MFNVTACNQRAMRLLNKMVKFLLEILWIFTKRNHISILYVPFNKQFIFTIIDDTDYARYEYIKPIYDELLAMGMMITKTVWVLNSEGKWGDTTDTISNRLYRDYMLKLQESGFEISLHGVAGESSKRDQIIKGYDHFKQIFGHYPKVYVMHSFNRENFDIANPSSEYFWGDICRDKGTKYVRINKYVPDINTLNCYVGGRKLKKWKLIPRLNNVTKSILGRQILTKYCLDVIRRPLVYHMKSNPYVKYWFYSSYGNHKPQFLELLSDENIAQLVDERGVCITFTHLACGFCDVKIDGEWVQSEFEKFNGHGWTPTGWDTSLEYRLNPAVREQLQKIIRSNAWCVSVSEVLDRYLLLQNVDVKHKGKTILVKNNNNKMIEGITLQIDSLSSIKNIKIGSKSLHLDDRGRFCIHKLSPNQTVKLIYEYDTNNAGKAV